MRRLGIRTKAIVLFFACALLPCAVVAAGAFLSARAALEHQIVADLDVSAAHVLGMQVALFERALIDLRTWRDFQVMQDVLIDDEYGDIDRQIDRLLAEYAYFEELVVVNQAGRVVASTEAALLGRHLHAGAVRAELARGSAFQGLSRMSDINAERGFVFAMPIVAHYDPETVIGGLIGWIDWDQVSTRIASLPVAGAEQDAGHLLIMTADPDPKLLGTGAAPSANRTAGDALSGSVRPMIVYATAAADALAGLLLAAVGPAEQTPVLMPDGRRYIARAASSSGRFGDLELKIVAAVASDVAFAEINRLRDRMMVFSLFVATVAVAIGWFGGGSLVRPLSSMIAAMKRLAAGDHATAIPALPRQDEIGEMAAALQVFQATATDRERKQVQLVQAKEAAEAAELRIRHLAHHDALTGLPNRLHFNQHLQQALAMARRNGSRVGVLCLDLDGFKEINDTLGHPAGDQVLCRVSQRLGAHIRETDTLARMGGDEFALVAANVESADALAPLCARLIETVEPPIDYEGSEAVVGLSIGVAVFPDDGTAADDLLKKADVALYRAKQQGAGLFQFFRREMEDSLHQRRRIERDLRRALVDGGLTLHYQPQIRLSDRRIVGVEALLRWYHPDLGRVPPDLFIPLAEESGLIQPLGQWVLEQAVRDGAGWQAPGDMPIRIAVNLSPVQFRQRDLAGRVRQCLDDTGLPPACLKLEITEGVLLGAQELARSTLMQIKDLGVRISMDDFGTGYSSMSTLRHFPFDEIKIDRSFVRDLESDRQAAAIIRATVSLARSLDMLTVGEGLETERQLSLLRGEGCELGQGFFFAPPMPAAEIQSLLTGAPADQPVSAKSLIAAA